MFEIFAFYQLNLKVIFNSVFLNYVHLTERLLSFVLLRGSLFLYHIFFLFSCRDYLTNIFLVVYISLSRPLVCILGLIWWGVLLTMQAIGPFSGQDSSSTWRARALSVQSHLASRGGSGPVYERSRGSPVKLLLTLT